MNRRAEYDPADYRPRQTTDPDTLALLARDTSRKFHDLMDAAMLVSAFKYGAVADAYPSRVQAIGAPSPDSPLRDNAIIHGLAQMGSFGKRLHLYFYGQRNPDFGEEGEPEYLIAPGNAEYLVDAANFLMIEFMHPAHPAAHYRATDASGSPGRVMSNRAIYDSANQFKNTDIEPADVG
jgi:hypothetical protein